VQRVITDSNEGIATMKGTEGGRRVSDMEPTETPQASSIADAVAISVNIDAVDNARRLVAAAEQPLVLDTAREVGGP
jgi:hypothetical protein